MKELSDSDEDNSVDLIDTDEEFPQLESGELVKINYFVIHRSV